MTSTTTMRRSEGAEYLVIGHLVVEDLCFERQEDNSAGFDVLAIHRLGTGSARIHVTSRWAEDYDRSFPICGFDYDFLVHVALNKGFRFHLRGGERIASGIPDFVVLPVDRVRMAAARNPRPWTVQLDDIEGLDRFRNNWQLITEFVARSGDAQLAQTMPHQYTNARRQMIGSR